MTTEQLRKVIKVNTWGLTDTGLTVSYERQDSNPRLLHLILNRAETLKELWLSGTIDEYNSTEETATTDSLTCSFDELIISYALCQWEALSIAIRHEAEKELVKDTNMLEIDNMLNALK